MNVDPTRYTALLADIKQRIQTAQTRAIISVNQELIRLYWEIGALIDHRQQTEGWGTGVIPKLAIDLKNELPAEIKGFSERNLKRMLAFHRAYADIPIVPQAVAQLQKQTESTKVPQAVAQLQDLTDLLLCLGWGQHMMLLEKIKDRNTRFWYMQQSIEQGWGRNILTLMIENHLHLRQGKVVTNFNQRLPSPQSDLIQQALKDPYIFDFLSLTEPYHERELETGLLHHLQKFLLELGQGFAFVGRQYPLTIGDQDFYIDLLFYHLKLRCFIIIELKKGVFKPEYAGKINFYCNVIDDQLKHVTDQPTIGLILCQNKNAVVAEYTLRGFNTPIGISQYELTRALPKELASKLPSVEQIEAQMAFELSESEFQKLPENVKN